MLTRRLALVPLVVSALAVACGGDSDPESLQPQIGRVALTAERDGDATVLSAPSPVSPKVTIPDEALPTGVSSEDLSGSVTYLTDPETGVTAVEFEMGPDGTRFDSPVQLSWEGYPAAESTTVIMAVSATGENLLDRGQAAEILDSMSAADEAAEGKTQVTVDIDHFSSWTIFQSGNRISAWNMKGGFRFVEARLEGSSWSRSSQPTRAYDLSWYLWDEQNLTGTEVCFNPTVTVTGGATIRTTNGEQCDVEDVFRSVYLSCPDTTASGEIRVDFNAYYGVAGFKPFEKLVILLGSTKLDKSPFSPPSETDSPFAAASDLALFVSGSISEDYNCADGAPPTTLVNTTTTSSETSSTIAVTDSSTSTTIAVVTTPTGVAVSTTSPRTSSSAPNTTSPSTATTTPRAASTTTTPRATTTTPYASTTTSTTSPPSAPAGTWLRNESRCSWRGSSSCGVYSSGSPYFVEVGPAGGPSSTFTPIAGTPGELAYNLYSGNSVVDCDWSGSGGCGYYFTGTAGTLNIGPLG